MHTLISLGCERLLVPIHQQDPPIFSACMHALLLEMLQPVTCVAETTALSLTEPTGPAPSSKKTPLPPNKRQSPRRESKCSRSALWNCATGVQCFFDNLSLNVWCGWSSARSHACRSRISLSLSLSLSLSNSALPHRFGISSTGCPHFQRARTHTRANSGLWSRNADNPTGMR